MNDGVESTQEKSPKERWISFTVKEEWTFFPPLVERLEFKPSFNEVCRKCLFESGEEELRLFENGVNSLGLLHSKRHQDNLCTVHQCMRIDFNDSSFMEKLGGFLVTNEKDVLLKWFVIPARELDRIIGEMPTLECRFLVFRENCPYILEHVVLH